MSVETWLLLAAVAVLAWAYSKWRHTYWSSRGVPSPPSLPFLGHYHKEYFIDTKSLEFYQAMYTKFYNSLKCGLYSFFDPVLVIWDQEMLKNVFVKDFDHFNDLRDFNLKTGQERDEMMAEMLSFKHGEEWKSLRAVMTPTFSSGKMKTMFPLMCDKADALVKFTMKQAAKKPHLDMKRNFGRFTINTIASCAFGIECNSLEDENDIFHRKVDQVFKTSSMLVFKTILFKLMPRLFKLLGLSLSAPETDFFIDVVKQTIAARKAGKRRGDFLDLLLEAQQESNNTSKQELSDLTIVAQSVVFLAAGYETTASLLSFSSFLLAKHKDQQQRLRDEVLQMVAEHGGITYQGITEAKLLEACLQESLRLYPPAVITERACTKTYTFPDTDITIKPGHIVEIPIWCIHHDPRHWPDPEAFIPDRFLPEKKGDIRPYTFLPFGMGPRNCIGMRFALLEAKVGLAKLLLEAELEVAPGHEELSLETENGLINVKNGVMLVLKPLKE